jgi:hypothetical protein
MFVHWKDWKRYKVQPAFLNLQIWSEIPPVIIYRCFLSHNLLDTSRSLWNCLRSSFRHLAGHRAWVTKGIQLTQTAIKKAILGLDEQKGLEPEGFLSRFRWRFCKICRYWLAFFLLFRKNPLSFRFTRMVRNGISLAIVGYFFIGLFEKMICDEITPIIRPQMVSSRAVLLSPT